MAPFKPCTMCAKATKKVVRDGLTWKKVYVCPACYKSKEYIEKNARMKAVKKEETARKKAEKERCQNNVKDRPTENKENVQTETPKELELKLENQVKVNEVHVKGDKPTEKDDKPTEKDDKPTEKVDKPTEKADKPTEKVDKPTEKADKPTEKVNKPNEKAEEVILPNDMVEEMPLNETTNASNSPKITPPLMEIVVINSRKYIVVSETADDN